MSVWPSTKAKRVKAALLRIGWQIKRQCGTSHCILCRVGYPDFFPTGNSGSAFSLRRFSPSPLES